MKLNEDRELVKEICAALRENKKLYGKPYCPCVPSYKYATQNEQDYVCPCKDFRENVDMGEMCHCGLYIKEE